MNQLKLIARFFTRLFFKITPAGRKKLMYEKALDNMKETHIVTKLEKRILKSQVRFFVNKTMSRRKLSSFHINQLVQRKFGEELEKAKLVFIPSQFTVIDRSEIANKEYSDRLKLYKELVASGVSKKS